MNISSACFQGLRSPSQEYCSLHCTCSSLPAPHLPAEDEVCSRGSPFLSSISCPLNDKCFQFRSLLFYRFCSIGPHGEEAILRNGIPKFLVGLSCKTLVNLSTSLFAVYLDSRTVIVDLTDYERILCKTLVILRTRLFVVYLDSRIVINNC